MRIRRNANSTWRLGVRHHTRKVMRRALRSWNETHSSAHIHGAPDDRRDAPSRHRHAPRLPRPGHRGAPAALLCASHVDALPPQARGGPSASGARSPRQRARSQASRVAPPSTARARPVGARLSALRANAVEQRARKSLARMSLSGREQLAGMETRSAFSVLRTHAQASRRAKTSLLVSSQRGVAMRAAALLQPLRALAVLLQSRALQQWASASVCIALDRRVSGLQAVLEAEAILKRRQYEAHQAELDKQRKEQQRQQAAQKLQAEAADLLAKGLVSPIAQTRQHLRHAAFAGGRSALDKLFAVLDVWEARRLRPALMAWKRASDAVPSAHAHQMSVAQQMLNLSTGSTSATGLFAGYAATPLRPPAATRPHGGSRPTAEGRTAPPSSARLVHGRHQW